MLALQENRVAVIDDNEDGRDTLVDDLSDFDFEPVAIMGSFGGDIDRLVREVEAFRPGFVICDHRLAGGQFGTFTGLEVVERLIADSFPAMLVTTYQEPERKILRAASARVPVILGRDRFNVEDVRKHWHTTISELQDMPIAARRPHRVLVRVEAARRDEIDVVVPSWNNDHAFVVQRSDLGETIRMATQAGDYLLGDVNIGATNEEDIYFDKLNEIVEGEGDIA